MIVLYVKFCNKNLILTLNSARSDRTGKLKMSIFDFLNILSEEFPIFDLAKYFSEQ